MISSILLAVLLAAPAPAPAPAPEPEPQADPIPVAAPANDPGPGQAPVRVEPPAADRGTPPNPHARPSEGVYAVGSSGVAPLPPAPPPVSPSTIRHDSWRGVGWLAVRLHVMGPLAGDTPGRPTVIALGGGAEGGWRIRQWVAVGTGFSRQPHESYRDQLVNPSQVVKRNGYMSAWDLAFVRLYAPVRGRIDPFIDLGGGLGFFEPARNRPILVGATVRASAGFEAWVSRNVTLGLFGVYRANFMDESIGHAWQAGLNLGLHW
ncbi:hypothetical protein [Enhygromyxa salina]|uniref:hypothetical protein n=1 Tax=Enhygromyxa salina TaxID=215803 RepID=UPI0006968FFC|nr:hypothetical protein [Enhygromyxa salina]